jgi:hypothetical protein
MKMRKYRSHKIVEAGRIISIKPNVGYDDMHIRVDVGGGIAENMVVLNEVFSRGIPDVGDYMVRYAPDGYLSWSPAKVFEDGYALLEEAS